MSQQCNTCHIDLPESEFYMQDGFRLFKKCKKCIAASKPKKPRTNGYAQLTQETQASLKAALADRRQKLPQIAEAHGIKYANLAYWVRSGKVG